MSKEYFKITLLEDMVTAIDYGIAGTVRYWKVVKRYKNGDVLIENSSSKALLWAEDIKKGLRISKRNFNLPNGMKLKIETGYKRKWYGKYYIDPLQTSKDKEFDNAQE